jgi:hypothetical protein
MLLVALLFYSCITPAQDNNYSIIGSWKLVAMQLDGKSTDKNFEEALEQNETRFIYDASGQFKMALSIDGRGLQGGYHYNPSTKILSVIYGAHTDTALVSWVNANKMIHTSTDGKTSATLERIIE